MRVVVPLPRDIMSVRGEPNPSAVRRLALRQMELGLTEIRSALADECTDAAIHAVRVRLKRTRALLRLIAHALGPQVPDSFDQRLRALHHRLGGHRDQAVLRSTARHVLKRYGEELPSRIVRTLNPALVDALGGTAAEPQPLTPAEIVREIRRELLRLHRTIGMCEPSLFDDAAALSIAADDYRQARRRLCRARRDHRPENLHALRKSVKRIGYHRCLLTPIWPADWGLEQDRLERLGDRLGRHQDVCLLLDALQQPDVRERIDNEDAVATFEEIGHRYRRDLARRCRRMGRKTLRPVHGLAHDRSAVDADAELVAL